MKRILIAGMGLFLCLLNAFSAENAAPERVTKKGGKVLAIVSGQSGPLTKPVLFPGDVLVNTNGTFTVKKGKARELKEGQTLTADGVLHNPDGSVTPVVDHVTLRGGRVLVVKDGEPALLTQNMTLPDGSVLRVDGTIQTGGRIRRLLDGNVLTLEGAPLQAKDTINMKDGKVFVFKDGAQYNLQPAQIMVMNDGTRVQGNGTVTYRDGKVRSLRDGDALVVEGAVFPK